MNKDAIIGLVRHLLTFGGGWAVSQGWGSQDEITQGIGAAVTLIGLVWSVLNKKQPA